jgi:hypothetical protein
MVGVLGRASINLGRQKVQSIHGQIRARLHDDDLVPSSKDVEGETTVGDAEIALAGQHLRFPDCGWATIGL